MSAWSSSPAAMATVSPTSPKIVKRKGSVRRKLPPYLTDALEIHNAAIGAIRSHLKSSSCYDAFPVSFRLIVLDTKLNVKKALQCLLLNGMALHPLPKASSNCRSRSRFSPAME